LVSSWMAACAEDWMGNKLNAEQAAILNRPIFNNDEDLKRALSLEGAFHQGSPAN